MTIKEKYAKEREENKGKRLVMLGTAISCFETDWNIEKCEYWATGSAFGEAHKDVGKIDLGFEIHDIYLISKIAVERKVDYNKFNCPVLVQNADHVMTKQLIDNPVTFPLEDMLEYVKEINGAKFFTSTFCFMLVYAAMLGYKDVALHKILLTNDGEYFLERPGVEYWIDLLGQKEEMAFNFPEDAEMWAGSVLYGYEERPNIWKIESRRKSLWMDFMKHYYHIEYLNSSISKTAGMIDMFYAMQKEKDIKKVEGLIEESKKELEKKTVELNSSRDKYMMASGALQSQSFSEIRGY